MPENRRRLVIVFALACLCGLGPAVAGEARLSWDASPGATGYRVYWGSASGQYDHEQDVANVLQVLLEDLPDCDAAHFAVRAYNAAGDSALSSEITSWPRPAPTAASPTSVEQGSGLTLVLSGASFQTGATLSLSNPGISVTSIQVDSCDQITAELVVGGGAATGPVDVEVIQPNGVRGSAAGLFSVVSAGDTEPPTTPQNLLGTAWSGYRTYLVWAPSSDGAGSGIGGYRIYRDGVPIADVAETRYVDSGVEPSTGYSYAVAAFDNAQPANLSPLSANLNLTTLASDHTTIRVNCGGADFIGGGGELWAGDTGFNTGSEQLRGDPIAGTTDDLLYQSERWDPPGAPELEYEFDLADGPYTVVLHLAEISDASMASGLRVFDVEVEGQLAMNDVDIYAEVGGFAALTREHQTTVSDGRLAIRFLHQVANPKISAIEILGTGEVVDQQPPSVPVIQTASASGPTEVSLSWSPSSDSGTGVAGYRVFRDGSEVGTTTDTNYVDTGLQDGTTYGYRVSAFDLASPPNESDPSGEVDVTTPVVEDPPGQVQNVRRTDVI